MSQTEAISELLKQQPDLSDVRQISEDGSVLVYKVNQWHEGQYRKQSVRVVTDIHNHYVLQREKDLMHYLNQFQDDFPRFNEIRKQSGCYLKFFDYVGDQTLAKRVKKNKGLPAEEARHFLANMISTLTTVHSVGFVHSQIRPENVIVGDNRYYLTNWKSAMPSLASFETELLVGDQSYTSPERLNGEVIDASDIYQLGCCLYFMLTGKHIYRLKKSTHLFDQLYAHANHTPSKLNRLPIFWRQLIIWMTQKAPEKRQGLAELNQWLKDETVPKKVRKQKNKVVKDFPDDSLTALADCHYLYAIFKKASLYEASGDLETAFNLYENGAFQGYTRSENNLGLMYEKGVVVRQSYIKAMNLYHHAFEKGNPYAAFNLARLFEKGLGVPQNVSQAFKLYRFAAMRGHLPAQNKLGELYLAGVGTVKNYAKARAWFGLAANVGYEVAQLNIKRLLSASIKKEFSA